MKLTQKQKDAVVAISLATTLKVITGFNLYDHMSREESKKLMEEANVLTSDKEDEILVNLFKEYLFKTLGLDDKLIEMILYDETGEVDTGTVKTTYTVDVYWGTLFPEKLIGISPDTITVEAPYNATRKEVVEIMLKEKGAYPKSYTIGKVTRLFNDKEEVLDE